MAENLHNPPLPKLAVSQPPSVLHLAPGSSPDHPEVDLPAAGWRWAVANWPHARWSAWHRRVGEILAEVDRSVAPLDAAEAPGPDVDEIREAQRLAYDEMTRPSLFNGSAIG